MTAINSVAELTIDGEVATVTINSPPVNALSQTVRDGLKRGVEAAEANGAVKAIVIICAGRTFIAGADISESASRPPRPICRTCWMRSRTPRSRCRSLHGPRSAAASRWR